MLFNIPKRKPDDVNKIIEKVQETAEFKPVLKVRGKSLLSQISAIATTVKQNLGDVHIKIIESNNEWLDYCRKALDADYIAIDTETDGLDTMRVHLAGVCIQSDNQEAVYAPVGHISNITEELLPNQVSIEAITEGLNLIKSKRIVMHNAYYDMVVLHQTANVDLPIYFDTLIASSLLNENEPHGLKYLYDKYVMNGEAGVHKFAELFDGIPITRIPPNICGYYCCHDAEMTLQYFKWVVPFFTKGTSECSQYSLERVADLFWTVDMPMLEVLKGMKIEGILFDFKQAVKLKSKYEKLKHKYLIEFNRSVMEYSEAISQYNLQHPDSTLSMPIDYNSPQQLKILFYDIAKIPIGLYKKEPTGTGKNVVDAILHTKSLEKSPIFTIVQHLSLVKMYDKAIGTFIDKLTLNAKEHSGKIHCDFSLVATDTGRLASRNPNLQQVPSRLGDIRTMFVAGENRVFINCDFSKQEPCILASSCEDKKLVSVFEEGKDIYSAIASMMYPEFSYEECLEHNPDGTTNHDGKNRRSAAKKVVLSIMYSKGVKSLAEDIHVTPQRAQEIYDNVLTSYPDMAQWMKDKVNFAYKYGYVDNFFGRRRRLPSLLKDDFEFIFNVNLDERAQEYYKGQYLNRLKKVWKDSDIKLITADAQAKGITVISNKKQKADDYRRIVNFCIQGGAAVVTKKAMLNIYNNTRLRELGCKLILSIHDESMCSVPVDTAYECAKLIEKCSIDAGNDLAVKLSCDIAITKNWYGQEYTFNDNHELVELKEV